MGCPGLHGSGVRGKGRGPATLHTLRHSTSGNRAYTHFTTQPLSGHLGLQGQVQEDLFTQRTQFLDRLRQIHRFRSEIAQDYRRSAAGVMIRNRCVGQRQEPVMSSTQAERRQRRESERERESIKQKKTYCLTQSQPARHGDHDTLDDYKNLLSKRYKASCD